jgi:tetratricopeptide (TPR) repeat protein
MKVSRDELVLLGLELLIYRRERNDSYTKEDLSNALDISQKTLNEYFTKLKKAGLIERNQKKFIKDLDIIIKLTPDGRKRVKMIEDTVDRMVLTPEHHNIPACIEVKEIIKRLRDPLEILFFLSLYSSMNDFDLIMFLDALKISKTDHNIVRIFSDMELDEGEPAKVPFIVTFSKSTFHGRTEKDLAGDDPSMTEDINAMLIIAESNQKQGKLKDALNLYNHILSPRNRISQNQWFIARMGLVQTKRKMGEFQVAFKLLEETMEMTNNKTFLAYSRQLKALMYSIMGGYDESMKLYNSAIRSFHSSGLPLMLSIAYNNRGTLYYRKIDYPNAEEDWKKARKYAKEAKSEYCEAVILTNLAELRARDGNFNLAIRYLKRAFNIIREIGDYESMAGVEFNLSLVYIMKGDRKKALDSFNQSMKTAFPLPSPPEKEEWKKTLINFSNEFNCQIDECQLDTDSLEISKKFSS